MKTNGCISPFLVAIGWHSPIDDGNSIKSVFTNENVHDDYLVGTEKVICSNILILFFWRIERNP